jgi:hypothetical protein
MKSRTELTTHAGVAGRCDHVADFQQGAMVEGEVWPRRCAQAIVDVTDECPANHIVVCGVSRCMHNE